MTTDIRTTTPEPATDGPTVQGIDPSTGRPVGAAVRTTTSEQLDAVLTAAVAIAPNLRHSPPSQRSALLHALADALTAQQGSLVPLAASESGLPVARLNGEVARTAYQLRFMAEVLTEGSCFDVTIDTPDPGLVPPRPWLGRVLEPLGPVLVFAASNFPFAFSVLGGDTASAIAAGCPVLVKAHPGHPGLSEAVAVLARRVVEDHDLVGAFDLVHGMSVGTEALRDPRIRACGFTGSVGGGRALFDIAVGRADPIPFYGELGSINPAVVTRAAVAARGEEIAAGFVSSYTLGVGQFCTKPGLLFLPVGHGLLDVLRTKVGAVGDGVMLTSAIAERFDQGVAHLASATDTVVSGVVREAAGAWAAPALFRVSAADFVARPELADECFGPAALVVEYDGLDDLLAALAVVSGSLTGTLHAEEGDDLDVVAVRDQLAAIAGRVLYNGWPTGVAVAWGMQHGGPWPSSTSARETSVGAAAIGRWLRPVTYQSFPEALLPPALAGHNPWSLPRRVDGVVASG